MKLAGSYLEEKERVELIEEFILHEVTKIDSKGYIRAESKIRDRTSNQHLKIFINFKKTIGENVESARKELITYSSAHKWMLFHSISYGVLYKNLSNCVGWNELIWQKMSLLYSDLQFETKIDYMREIEAQNPFFIDVLNYAQSKYDRTKDDRFLKNSNHNYFKAGKECRLNDPIICKKEDGHYLIHDGTGRMLMFCTNIVLNQIDKNTKITAWVGERIKPTWKNKRIYEAAKRELFTIREHSQWTVEDKPKSFIRLLADPVIRRYMSFSSRLRRV